MAYENIILEKRDAIAYLTLNRPDVLNALDAQLMGELDEAITEISRDEDVRVVILTGAGEKAFAAGADISELAKNDAPGGRATADNGQRVLRRLERLGKPSIAAVNGFALGGGCELAMACSIRIASEKARFGQPEVNLGLIPGYAGTQRLARIVGRGVAMDLVLTGRAIDATEALRIGLVTQVVSAEELMAAAEKTAKMLIGKAPMALRAAMEVIDRGVDIDFEAACTLEATAFGLLFATADTKEGLSAFLEKRKPDFKGK